MPEKTVFDQYKEMVQKTRQLHSELVELSSKVDVIVGTIDTSMYDSITPTKRILPSGSDTNVSSDLDDYPERDSSKRQGSDFNKH